MAEISEILKYVIIAIIFIIIIFALRIMYMDIKGGAKQKPV